MKKWLSLFLTLCLLLGLVACGAQTETVQTEEPQVAETATAEEAAEQPVEKSGDVVILYTSDVHCGIDQGFGYAGLQQVRDYLLSKGDEVILVDNGDSIQGEPIGTMTKGEEIINLMNQIGYEIAIPGNHDFDYGMERFLELKDKAQFPYISCNFNKAGELVLKPYEIRELAGKKIGFVGVTTPQTLVSSTPRYFMDENGEFLYGFFQEKTGKGVYDAVQSAVNAARDEGAQYIVVLGHMGNGADAVPWTYEDVITHTYGINVFLDGHSHDTDQVTVRNVDGSDVLRSACGTKLEHIGWCRISADGDISTGLFDWDNKISAPQLLMIDNEMDKAVDHANEVLEEKLSEVVAFTTVDLTINDPKEKDMDGKPIRRIRSGETNLGDFCADAYRDQSGAEIAFVNGGGIRKSIDAGNITLGDLLSVHPFGNYLCVVETSGQSILDALEWGVRALPGESGSFQQVSGLTYEIDCSIESTCVSDENGMFAGVEGARRVKNVLVGGEPIDPEKTYTLAGHNYLLQSNGDGCTMFDDAKLVQDKVKLDNQVLIDYIMDTLGGQVGEEYADPYGQGRIVFLENGAAQN